MNLRIGKRNFIRILTFFLSALIVASIFAVEGRVRYMREKQENDYSLQRAVLSLSETVDSIDVTLKKTLCAGSAEQFAALAAKLCTEAATAKADLSQIPASVGELNNVNRFISQVGDYAVSLANKRYLDEDLTDEELKKLRELEKYTAKLKLTLDELMARGINDADFSSDDADDIETAETGGSTSVMADDFTDYPTLIYDGPFSDHIYEKKPSLVKNSEKVSQDKALETAKRFSSNDSIEYSRAVDGNLPLYVFSGENIEVGVTVQGGVIAYMINSRNVGSTRISVREAEEAARRYLSERGFENMRSNYFEIYSNCCVLNFTAEENGIVLYPDLIKVSVALDNGEVVELDARDYVMNHHDRTDLTAKKTKKEAAAIVSRQLKIEESQLAVIPTNSKNETLCWEFLCEGEDDTEVLVYVNADTLKEEKILLVLENENGKLTI